MKEADHRELKDRVFQELARIGKALASPRRLELLDLLAQTERAVEDLATRTGMSVANTSQHLRVLLAARLVDVRRDGLHGYYRLAEPRVFDAVRTIRGLAESRLAELDRVRESFLAERDQLEAVGVEELLQRLAEAEVVVLDVRPAEEYLAGHIPGALSFPVSELEQRLAELPAGREIVAYCRGPYCVYSDEAVMLLRARGYRARRLEEGLPDWRAAGHPVAVGGAAP